MTPVRASVRAALALIAAATLLRLLFASITDLGLDEAYALAVTRELQLSWFDHPPMVFWIAGVMQAVFGLEISPVLLRLPFILLGAGTAWLLFRLTVRHFGERAGLWTLALFLAAPFFFISAGSWVVPDGPLTFFLVAASLALTPIVLDESDDEHWGSWLLFGLALGFALLSKYHAALFALGVVICFAAQPRLRRWFARPQPYVAFLLAVLVFTPVIVWNAQNEWVSFAFQFGRGAPGGASLESIGRISLFEAAYLLPTTFVLLVAAVIWAFRRLGRSTGFFLALGLLIVLILDATRFWTWQSYGHWSMPGWMLLMPLLGAMLAATTHRWLKRVTIAVTAILLAVFVAGVVLLTSPLRIADRQIDEYRLEAGHWSAVLPRLRAAGMLEGDPFIVTAYWRDAARMAEALRLDLPVLVFDFDPRGFAWTDQQALIGRDAIIATQQPVPGRFEGYFESIELIESQRIEEGSGAKINLYLGRNFLKPYPLDYGPR